MATVGELYRFLDQRAPFAYQLDFDNAGFLLGREGAQVSLVLVALDLTEAVLTEAIELGAELIVTHHPVIWDKRATLTDADPTGTKLLRLIEAGIAVISAHTNLDAVEGGVNTVLAETLGLVETCLLHEDGVDATGHPYGIGRVGLRARGETSAEDFAQEVKRALHLDGLRLMDAGQPVFRVAVGGGACGGMLADVLRHGCDTFVTAELKHDVYLEAYARGINLIDAGHYATETPVCAVLADWLREGFPTLQLSVSKRQSEVFSYR